MRNSAKYLPIQLYEINEFFESLFFFDGKIIFTKEKECFGFDFVAHDFVAHAVDGPTTNC